MAKAFLLTQGIDLSLREFPRVRAHLPSNLVSLQVNWTLWAGQPLPTSLDLEAAAIIATEITQPFEGAALGALYLAERVQCQLVGRDDPQIPMDPPKFMLAPHSMIDAQYNSQGSDVPYVGWLFEGLDYEEFNITRLMPSLTAQVYAQSLLLLSFPLPCLSWLLMVENLQQEEPTASELIDPLHLPWMVYAYGLDGFAWEHVVPYDLNVMGYPFPPITLAASFSSPLFFCYLFFLRSLTFLSLNYNPPSKSTRSWYGQLGISSQR